MDQKIFVASKIFGEFFDPFALIDVDYGSNRFKIDRRSYDSYAATTGSMQSVTFVAEKKAI